MVTVGTALLRACCFALMLLVSACDSKPPPGRGAAAPARQPSPNALDLYLLLPASCFSDFPSDPPTRRSYLNQEKLTPDFLTAEHWIEGDGGGFRVTLRIFRRPEGDLIALQASSQPAEVLFRREGEQPGLNLVTLQKPTFWRYQDGWQKQDDALLPSLPLAAILDLYRNHFKADQDSPDQQKFIHLDYELLPEGETIPVIGRENFMSSAPTWAEYTLTSGGFKKVP